MKPSPRALRREGEPGGRLFFQHRGGKRPKPFPMLDPAVEPFANRLVARIGQERAVAERRGPNSIRPWNQPTMRPSASIAAARSSGSANRSAKSPLRQVQRRWPCRRIHFPGTASSNRLHCTKAPHQPSDSTHRLYRGADGCSRIMGGCIHVDRLERPVALQPAVGNTVQRHAAAVDQVRLAGCAMQPAGLPSARPPPFAFAARPRHRRTGPPWAIHSLDGVVRRAIPCRRRCRRENGQARYQSRKATDLQSGLRPLRRGSQADRSRRHGDFLRPAARDTKKAIHGRGETIRVAVCSQPHDLCGIILPESKIYGHPLP